MALDKGSIVITGCSGGLGAALVRACLDAGYFVFATVRDLNNPGEIEELRSHAALDVLGLNVCDEKEVSDVVACVERNGQIDALIVNAGSYVSAAVETVDMAEAESLFDTNFFGALRCIQALAPVMRNQRSGKIIGISSLSAQIGLPCDGLYAASKAALEKIFESLRSELAPFGVEASVIVPASFPSKLMSRASQSALDKSSPYYPLLADLQAGRSNSSGSVENVVEAVMNLMGQSSSDFRVPGDERAAAILKQIYCMEEKSRADAIAEWSGAKWWLEKDL